MEITIRNLVKELLENEYLIVSYNEYDNGGFDLSVRINEKLLLKEQVCCMPEEKGQENDRN